MKLKDLIEITENPLELQFCEIANGRKVLKKIQVKNATMEETTKYHDYNVSLIETKVSFDMSTINDEIKFKSTIICYIEKE